MDLKKKKVFVTIVMINGILHMYATIQKFTWCKEKGSQLWIWSCKETLMKSI